jgi:hypothetical protein
MRSVEVCEGSLSPGSSFAVPAALAGVYRRVFPAARPGMTSAAGYDKEARHAHSGARQSSRDRQDMKLVRRNPRKAGGAGHRWI